MEKGETRMNMTEKLLDATNTYARPGRKLKEKKAVILHWVGVGGQRAASVWNFFNGTTKEKGHYSSAHYIIDIDGSILHCIPDDEVAYHCGSSQPVSKDSKQIYTDWARSHIGEHYCNPENSPNNATIGIEMCVTNSAGDFDPRTLEAASELVTHLCGKYKIKKENIGTHKLVVGWKDCPLLWSTHPEEFQKFLAGLAISY
jgi:N-acetylmuramoyl-L-alanine amidase